jgi:hypothetical protein
MQAEAELITQHKTVAQTQTQGRKIKFSIKLKFWTVMA